MEVTKTRVGEMTGNGERSVDTGKDVETGKITEEFDLEDMMEFNDFFGNAPNEIVIEYEEARDVLNIVEEQYITNLDLVIYCSLTIFSTSWT